MNTSNLTVRKIPFNLEHVDILWNKKNPSFSNFINKFSFWAPALERYVCRVIREAQDHIHDPETAQEAKLFFQQEAEHSKSHLKHVKRMVELYPGLQAASDRINAHYDQLYRDHSMEYHLAYIAGLEATFSPAFRSLIEGRRPLFSTGDANVSSLCLWHFNEEIEHRSSALMVYNAVVGRTWYRLCQFRSVVKHVKDGFRVLEEEFGKAIPKGDRGPMPELKESPFGRLPVGLRLKLKVGIVLAQAPWHDPSSEKVPEWSQDWFNRYAKGEDMSKYYGIS